MVLHVVAIFCVELWLPVTFLPRKCPISISLKEPLQFKSIALISNLLLFCWYVVFESEFAQGKFSVTYFVTSN